MEKIHSYLLSVICAAIICSVVHVLSGKKSASSSLIRIISGIFMAITLISPLINIRLSDYADYFSAFSSDANAAVTFGESAATDALRSIIKARTEAYILDKADSMNVALDVEVKLNNEDPPVPCEVVITGAISPYSKEVLSQYIANDLGISKEDQLWTSVTRD